MISEQSVSDNLFRISFPSLNQRMSGDPFDHDHVRMTESPDKLRGSGTDDTHTWFQPYLAFVFALIACSFVFLLVILIWCCIRGRSPRKDSAVVFPSPTSTSPSLAVTSAQINVATTSSSSSSRTTIQPDQKLTCVLPSPELTPFNGFTPVQPDVHRRNVFERPCVAFGTPMRSLSAVHASGHASPVLSSCTGSPVTGCGTPINTPPLRLRAMGLLERRGSSASLTLDLGSSPSESPIVGSPPRESANDEYLKSASNPMTYNELMFSLTNRIGIHKEFWEIPTNHPDRIEVSGSGVKNRYRTILPNENTRVKLLQSCDDPLASYINANYIRGYRGEPCAYIATQGPLTNTLVDFWKMIWQEKVPIIVMITKLQEQNSVKCESYIPESSRFYGDFEVTIESIDDRGSYVERQLSMKSGTELHTVEHYWYTVWPDHKAPAAAKTLLDLVKEVEERRYDVVSGKAKGPVVVHCSAGIGRTGCFIATSIGIQQLEKEHTVDVLGIVCNLRLDRGGMVQTNEQYEFVHQALGLCEKKLSREKSSQSIH